MKHIWIMNHYASDMFFNKGGRHYWFAKYLKRAGYEPVVFCCNARHSSNCEHYNELNGKLWCDKTAEDIQVPFVFVQGRDYRGNGKQRVLNMIDFYRNVKKAAKEYAKLHEKPDVIYASSVHPLTLVAGIQLAKYFKVKCICEVRDLWPESLVAYGIVNASNPAVIVLRKLEKWTYKKADSLIFSAEGMYEYIKEQRWEKAVPLEKVYYINNGVDLENFDYNRDHYQIEDKDLDNPEFFKVVYAGSVRRVNNLGLLLDAAKLIKDKRIRILIWGDGDELEMLKLRAQNEEIKNVVLKGRVEKQYVPYITSKADVNIAHNTPSSLFKYGISFNKLFDYLAAGKPIFSDFPSAFNPAVQYGAGWDLTDSSKKHIAEVLEKFSSLSASQLSMYGHNARMAAEQRYDYIELTKKLIQVFEQ